MLFEKGSVDKKEERLGSGAQPIKDERIMSNTDNFSFGKLNEEEQGWKTSSFSDGSSRRKLEFTDGSEQSNLVKPENPGNPFENYLDKTVPQRERPWIKDGDKPKAEPIHARNKDSLARESNENLDPTSRTEKPPIRRTSSLSKIKKMEEKLNYAVKDNKELERIANIMKQDFSKSKNMYNFSSDSDS